MSYQSMSQPSSVSAASANSNRAVNGILDSAAHAKAIQLASATLETCAAAAAGNPTVAMAATHLVTTLLWQSMRWDPAHPQASTCDRLLLSDSAFAPLLYVAAADLGVPAFVDGAWRPLTSGDLARFGAGDGPLPVTPAPATLAIVEHGSGAHGLGLSHAVGHALAARLDGHERRIFCLVSEAELREGQIWEALAHIVEEKLTAVTPIFVVSAPSLADRGASVDSPDALVRRLAALGFHATTIDGHVPSQIRESVEQGALKAKSSQPCAIVARTVKGWGAKSVQGGAWSGRIPTGDKLKIALEELRSSRVGLTRSFGAEIARPTAPAQIATSHEKGAAQHFDAVPDFARAMRDGDMNAVYHSGRLAPRRAHALAMRALGRAHRDVVMLECDARSQGASELFAADRASAQRSFELRSAEAHMMSAATACAQSGKTVFAAASARALLRAHEPIESCMQQSAGLSVVATSAGLSAIAEGAASISVSDVAWFRSLSTARDAAGNAGGYLLQPSDAFSAYALTIAAAEHAESGRGGLSYLRLPAGELEFLYNGETVFNLGKFEVLVEGRDLLIITAGAMVHEVNRALDGLDAAGIDATIVDLYSIPFDEDALLDLANENGGRILVVEDNLGGAMASAVSDACAASGDAFTVESMCVRSVPKSARNFAEALRDVGLSAEHIVARARRIVGVESGR